MYFVLYDENLKTIGNTYLLESWSRVQRATDFDEINITGEQIPYSANPFLVVINDKQGRQMFSGLTSSPTIDEKAKKTKFTLKDYLTLFNSDVVLSWLFFSSNKLSDYIQFIFEAWKNQIDIGLKNVECDTSQINDILLDLELYNFTASESASAYSLISNAINYYELYCESSLNLETKTLVYKFKKASLNSQDIKLSDFGINALEKSFGDYNRVNIYNSNYEQRQAWALTKDNKIYKMLPFEYEELEYIQSTGTQYIDCYSFGTNKNLKFVIDYKLLNNPINVGLLGNSGSRSANLMAYHTTNDILAINVGSKKPIYTFTNIKPNTRYLLTIEKAFKILGLTTTLQEFEKEAETLTGTYSGSVGVGNNNNIYLFAVNNEGTQTYQGQGFILYSFKVYENDIIVKNYIPCKRKKDGIVGLFESVNNEFIPNKLTDNFVGGEKSQKFIYPTKNKNYIAEEPTDDLTESQAVNDATYEAVMGLAQHRYQENIELNVQQYKSIIDLSKVDFSYIIRTYLSDGNYVDLPVGEIETDSNGKHIIRLGYQILKFTQEL